MRERGHRRLGEELAGPGRRGGRRGGQGRRTPRLTHSTRGGCLTPATAWPSLPPASNFAADGAPSPANLERSRSNLPPPGTPRTTSSTPPGPSHPPSGPAPPSARGPPGTSPLGAGGRREETEREGGEAGPARGRAMGPPPSAPPPPHLPAPLRPAPRDGPPRPLGAPLTRCSAPPPGLDRSLRLPALPAAPGGTRLGSPGGCSSRCHRRGSRLLLPAFLPQQPPLASSGFPSLSPPPRRQLPPP